MRDAKWFVLVVVVAAAVVTVTSGVALLLAGGGLALTHTPATASASPRTTYLNLTIRVDPATGAAMYATPSLTMAAHTHVIVTITNFDPTIGNLYVPWDNRVIGTMGGTETVNVGHGAFAVSSLPAAGISHTFTVFDNVYNISVPIPPASSASLPSIVSFGLTLNTPEVTTWACMCDCQSGAMIAGMYGPLEIGG